MHKKEVSILGLFKGMSEKIEVLECLNMQLQVKIFKRLFEYSSSLIFIPVEEDL